MISIKKYSSLLDYEQSDSLLIAAALQTDIVEKSSTASVLQKSLDDYYITYRINAFTKEPNRQDMIYSNVHANIQDHFNQVGMELCHLIKKH